MFKKRLSFKILLFVLVLIGTIFLVVGILTYSLMRDKVLESALERTDLQSQIIAREVDYIFENAKLYTFQMSLNRDITTYLKEVETRADIKGHPLYETVFDYLVKVKASNPLHFLAWVANEKANFYLDSSDVVPDESYEVRLRPWYAVALSKNEPTFTEPYVEWNTGKVVISSIMALREGGEPYGFVVVDIMLDQIPEILNQARLHESDLNFLISDSGDYLFHPDESKVLTTSVLDEEDPFYFYFASESMPSGVMAVNYSGEAYFMMTYLLEENNWHIVSLVKVDTLEKEVRALMVRIILLMIAAFVLTAVGVIWHVNRHTAPYKLLVSYAENIENGDYNKNIPEVYLNRTDEMGEVCGSFQRIINRFREDHSELSQTIKVKNDELEKQYHHIYQTEKAAVLGQIVAGVAHEINTPLGVSITLASHVEELYGQSLKKLEAGTMTRDDLKRYFNQMNETIPLLNHNLNRAATLVKSFKQISVDQFTEAHQNFFLKDVIDNVITSLKSEHKRKKITFHIECDPKLSIYGEPGVYAQLVTNFVMNAIQHGFKEKTSGTIQVVCTKLKNELVMRFIDDGSGIKAEDQERIFEPFFTTNRESGNSGLGMNIVYNLVTQKLGGVVDLKSQVGEFTEFVLSIPLTGEK